MPTDQAAHDLMWNFISMWGTITVYLFEVMVFAVVFGLLQLFWCIGRWFRAKQLLIDFGYEDVKARREQLKKLHGSRWFNHE
jgi:hypothetical protein